MSSFRFYYWLAGVSLGAASGAFWWALAHRKSLEQRERERRLRLSAIGRITDGTVLDLYEIGANSHQGAKLLIYAYDVSGVSYECSQDISTLGALLDEESSQVGLPASVKYDPRNPGNSIVLAEGWSGLRH